ncbi:MAG TPA: hypothetical protein VFA10_18140 [Ktedonobacteraceae bacterium]|nr:hypothetical protein [Ktedonobacteraceae bacterium]
MAGAVGKDAGSVLSTRTKKMELPEVQLPSPGKVNQERVPLPNSSGQLAD